MLREEIAKRAGNRATQNWLQERLAYEGFRASDERLFTLYRIVVTTVMFRSSTAAT